MLRAYDTSNAEPSEKADVSLPCVLRSGQHSVRQNAYFLPLPRTFRVLEAEPGIGSTQACLHRYLLTKITLTFCFITVGWSDGGETNQM